MVFKNKQVYRCQVLDVADDLSRTENKSMAFETNRNSSYLQKVKNKRTSCESTVTSITKLLFQGTATELSNWTVALKTDF